MDAKVSYKPQHVNTDFDGTVSQWLDSEIGMTWRSGEFNTQVIRPLQIDQMVELRARRLSGGGIAGSKHCNMPRERCRPVLAR